MCEEGVGLSKFKSMALRPGPFGMKIQSQAAMPEPAPAFPTYPCLRLVSLWVPSLSSTRNGRRDHQRPFHYGAQEDLSTTNQRLPVHFYFPNFLPFLSTALTGDTSAGVTISRHGKPFLSPNQRPPQPVSFLLSLKPKASDSCFFFRLFQPDLISLDLLRLSPAPIYRLFQRPSFALSFRDTSPSS